MTTCKVLIPVNDFNRHRRLIDWIKAHTVADDWGMNFIYDDKGETLSIEYTFVDPRIAVLFKLLFG